MFNPLSTITGYLRARRERIDRMIDERAQRLFLQMLLVHEEQETKKQIDDLEEKKKLAAAWMPFDPRKLTKGNAKNLTLLDDGTIQALEVIGEELRAGLSNRAMLTDGVAHDRAMYTMLGVNLYIQTLKQKIEHYGGQQKRKQAKEKAEAEKQPKETVRTMLDLYRNESIQATK